MLDRASPTFGRHAFVSDLCALRLALLQTDLPERICSERRQIPAGASTQTATISGARTVTASSFQASGVRIETAGLRCGASVIPDRRKLVKNTSCGSVPA